MSRGPIAGGRRAPARARASAPRPDASSSSQAHRAVQRRVDPDRARGTGGRRCARAWAWRPADRRRCRCGRSRGRCSGSRRRRRGPSARSGRSGRRRSRLRSQASSSTRSPRCSRSPGRRRASRGCSACRRRRGLLAPRRALEARRPSRRPVGAARPRSAHPDRAARRRGGRRRRSSRLPRKTCCGIAEPGAREPLRPGHGAIRQDLAVGRRRLDLEEVPDRRPERARSRRPTTRHSAP